MPTGSGNHEPRCFARDHGVGAGRAADHRCHMSATTPLHRLWSDPAYRSRQSVAHRLTWDADMLDALLRCIAARKSWAAIGRIVGVSPHVAWDEAFRQGWALTPSGSSRFGAAWRRARQ